jgi:hypothetical protein
MLLKRERRRERIAAKDAMKILVPGVRVGFKGPVPDLSLIPGTVLRFFGYRRVLNGWR